MTGAGYTDQLHNGRGDADGDGLSGRLFTWSGGHEDWERSYFSNEGQFVTEDARELAKALRRSIEDPELCSTPRAICSHESEHPCKLVPRGGVRCVSSCMSDRPDVAVVGPGAVGAFFGGMFAGSGSRVTMLGRPGEPGSHLRLWPERGLRIDSINFDERVEVEVASDPVAIRSANLVLFSVKTLDTKDAARRIAPNVADDQIVHQSGLDGARWSGVSRGFYPFYSWVIRNLIRIDS